jgi:hypothetical protein
MLLGISSSSLASLEVCSYSKAFGLILIWTGSYAARILVALIAVVGLPKTHKLSTDRKNRLFQRIYKGLTSGDLWIPMRLAEIRDGYKCMLFLLYFNSTY